MEGRKVPGIRFEGFEEEWEQRKLGEIFKERTERATGDEELLSVTIGNGVIRQADSDKRSIASEDKSNYKIVRKGDVPYNSMRMWQGAVGNSEYDGIVSPAYTVLVPTAQANGKFFMELFKKESTLKIFQRWSQGLTSDTWNLKYPVLSSIEFYIPLIEEQTKIAEYFKSLDYLITLHQRKYKRLKLFKESMLNKMFPKDSEKIPEIRFEGFSSDWKQHKLGKIASKITMKNTGSQYIETFTNSAEFGIISQRDFFDHNVSNIENIEGYYVVEDDVFVYNPRISTSAPVGPINRNKLGRTGVVSPLYTVFKTHDIDSEYLEWYFKSNHWHLFMYFNGDTGARSDRFSIKDSVFFEMPIPIPDIDEQIKIGKYLSKLDSLITLQQYKMENLQNFKKSLLEKMFT